MGRIVELKIIPSLGAILGGYFRMEVFLCVESHRV